LVTAFCRTVETVLAVLYQWICENIPRHACLPVAAPGPGDRFPCPDSESRPRPGRQQAPRSSGLPAVVVTRGRQPAGRAVVNDRHERTSPAAGRSRFSLRAVADPLFRQFFGAPLRPQQAPQPTHRAGPGAAVLIFRPTVWFSPMPTSLRRSDRVCGLRWTSGGGRWWASEFVVRSGLGFADGAGPWPVAQPGQIPTPFQSRDWADCLSATRFGLGQQPLTMESLAT